MAKGAKRVDRRQELDYPPDRVEDSALVCIYRDRFARPVAVGEPLELLTDDGGDHGRGEFLKDAEVGVFQTPLDLVDGIKVHVNQFGGPQAAYRW